MDFYARIFLVVVFILMLGGFGMLESKIDRQCTPPAASNIRVAV